MKGKAAIAWGLISILTASPSQAAGFSREILLPHPALGAGGDLPKLALQKSKEAKPKKVAAAPQYAQPQLQMPSGESMLIMIRSSLLALSQANQTNNYAVLNALGSDSFRVNNPPGRLSETFAAFRNNNIDLAPVAAIPPQLTTQPTFADGRLRMVGFFPSQPMQVNFDLTYEPTQAGWKLFGIAVNLNRAAQPQAAQPASR